MKILSLSVAALFLAGVANLSAAPQTRTEIAAQLTEAVKALAGRARGEGERAAAEPGQAAAARAHLERAVKLYQEQPDDDAAFAGLSYVFHFCARPSADARAACEAALPEARQTILNHWLDKQQAIALLMGSNDSELMDAAFEKGGRNRLLIAEIAAPYWVTRFQDPGASAAERKYAYDRVMKYGAAMAADETAIDVSGKTGVQMVRWKGEGLINTVQNMLPGKPMPDFGFTDLSRRPVSLADYKGKVVLLDFWATWCKPCVASMPAIKQFRAELQSQGKPFEVISVDAGDTPEKVIEFQKNSVDMPWVQWHQETFTREYFNIGIKGLPTYFVLDAEGRIFFRGNHFDDAMKQRVRTAVEQHDPGQRRWIP